MLGLCFSHHMTVGTSLLRNGSSKAIGLSQEQRDLLSRCSRLDVDAENECERLAGRQRQDPLLNAIRQYLASSPYEASAELNSLQPFIEQKMVDRVTLYYYADSGAAHLVSTLLQEYLSSLGLKASSVAVKEGERDLASGLLNLMNEVSGRGTQDMRDGCIVMLNITPGFKAEAAYSTLGVMLNGVTALAYYRHEAMKSTVGVPLLSKIALRGAVDELRRSVGRGLEGLSREAAVVLLAARLNTGRLGLGPVTRSDVDWAAMLLAAGGSP